MILQVHVEYLFPDRKSGIFKYRRAVPAPLRLAMGKREIVVSLRTKDQERALKQYAQVHAEAEEKLAAAARTSPDGVRYELTRRSLRDAEVIGPTVANHPPFTFDNGEDKAMKMAAHLRTLAIRRDSGQAGDGWNSDGEFERTVETQHRGLTKPRLTLSDAQRLYMDAKAGKRTAKRLGEDVERVVELLRGVMDSADPRLCDVRREDARAFRAALIRRGLSPATARRRITTMRALIELVVVEDYEPDLKNPFRSLTVPEEEAGSGKEKREALTVDEIGRVIPHLATKGEDIRDIWTLLTLTGARGAEICGLKASEVFLDCETPHILIQPNEVRGTKNGTKRKVPLVGAGLDCMHRRSGDPEGPVFPRYAKSRGADNASVLMVNAMKQADVWVRTKKVPYSLRHAHKDWMRRVAPSDMRGLIHDHAGGSIEANYGSDELLDMLASYIVDGLKRSGADRLEFQ